MEECQLWTKLATLEQLCAEQGLDAHGGLVRRCDFVIRSLESSLISGRLPQSGWSSCVRSRAPSAQQPRPRERFLTAPGVFWRRSKRERQQATTLVFAYTQSS